MACTRVIAVLMSFRLCQQSRQWLLLMTEKAKTANLAPETGRQPRDWREVDAW